MSIVLENNELAARWRVLLDSEPKLRIRDAARRLGVSEAQLLATRCGNGVTRLDGDWKEFLKWMPKLGRVMCLTRNEHAVHERYGEFGQVEFFHGMGQVVGPDIDLRLFMHAWKKGFAVLDETGEGGRVSYQFFNGQGEAVHKIYLQPDSHLAVHGVLLEQYRSEDQTCEEAVDPPGQKREEVPDREIDVDGFRKAWLELKDTHAFFNLLRKFQLGREQALRLGPGGYVREVGVSAINRILHAASGRDVPIMVFIGNPGCIQIHTGPVKNIRMFGEEWLNVLDPEFNMHLRQTAVASAYVVRKPTTDGDVTSLELFDADGENLLLLFGKRKPGQAEDEDWREIVSLVS